MDPHIPQQGSVPQLLAKVACVQCPMCPHINAIKMEPGMYVAVRIKTSEVARECFSPC